MTPCRDSSRLKRVTVGVSSTASVPCVMPQFQSSSLCPGTAKPGASGGSSTGLSLIIVDS